MRSKTLLKPSVNKIVLGCVLLNVLFITGAFADTIHLKNGRKIEGMVKKEYEDKVELDIGFGVVGFSKQEIDHIYKSTPQETQGIYKSWETNKKQTIQRREDENLRVEAAPKNVEFSKDTGHIIVDTLLNNTVSVKLLMDTGASVIVLSKSVGKKLNIDTGAKSKGDEKIELVLGDGSRVTAKRVKLKSVSVEGVEAKNIDAAILQEDISEDMLKDGVLGMSFLSKFNFRIDIKNKRLSLERLR